MPINMKKTGDTYRGATGTTSLEVRVVGGSWDELFEELRRNPKVFYELTTDTFVGERVVGGKPESRTPSVGVIQRELDRQAWYNSMILGFQDVYDDEGNISKDRFRVCMRTTDLEEVHIPKRIRELDLTDDQFGKLVTNGG